MSSSIHHIKMSFQTHPNVPFLQGWPGILAAEPQRKPPAVHGFMELRISGNTQVKAKYLMIEFVRLEHLPNTDPAKPIVTPIGTSITAWSAPHGAEWAYLEPADFKFYIPLPLNLPGSVELKPRGGGIRYELQAKLCQVHKSGVLRRESDNIMISGQPIYITKHELHAAWPIYNVPEKREIILENMEFTVTRPFIAFGPTDKVEVTATLKSNRQKPLKLRAFEMQLIEILTVRPPVAKGAKQPAFPKTRVIHEVRVTVTEKIARTEAKSRVLALTVPAASLALTIKGGQVIEVRYELAVKAIMEGTVDLKIEHMEAVVGTYPRARSHEVVNQIGWVDNLCPEIQQSPLNPARSAALSSEAPQSSIGHLETPTFAPNNAGLPWSPDKSVSQMDHFTSADPRQRIQPFTARPLSTDASSMYSYNQSLSEVSSVRDGGRDESVFNNRLTHTRPLSHVGSFAMPEPYVYNNNSPNGRGSPNTGHDRQNSLPSARVLDAAWVPGESSGARPVGPIRHGSGVSTRNSIASEASASRRSLDYREKSRLASLYNGTENFAAVPIRRSYIHQDAGPVVEPASRAPASPAIGASSSSHQRAITSPDDRWSSAEAEKERLYAEARRRAARTQSAAGGQVSSMGLAEDDIDGNGPSESPPSYSPPQRPNSALQSALEAKQREKPLVDKDSPVPITRQRSGTVMGVGIDRAGDRGNSQRPGVSEDRCSTPLASPQQSSSSNSRRKLTPAPVSEKEQMRLFFEAQQAVQGRSAQPSREESPQRGAQPSQPADPESPPNSFPSAESEKDAMRRRYEQASRAVLDTHGSSSSFSSSQPLVATVIGGGRDGQSTTTQYLSATEEKDKMRARYETAVRGIQEVHVDGGRTPGVVAMPLTSGGSGSYFPQGQGLNSPSQDANAHEGQRSFPDVPPLPARPPAEYKSLLAPTADPYTGVAMGMMPSIMPGAMPGMFSMPMAAYGGYPYAPMMQPAVFGQVFPPGPASPGTPQWGGQ